MGTRQRIGLIVAPLVSGGLLLAGDGSAASIVQALFALAGTLWICESIPLAATALLIVVGAVISGVATSKDAFAAFGSPVLFLFIGSFLLAEAMNKHGLGERIADALLSRTRGALGAMIALSTAAALISAFMSNTAAAAIALPLAIALSRNVDDKKLGAAMVLAVAHGASLGGLMTPIGTPPNLVGRAELVKHGIQLDFLDWAAFGVPLAAIMLVATWVVLALLFDVRSVHIAVPKRATKHWNGGEIASVVAFVGAIACWVTKIAPEEVVAIGAALVLFIWPISKEKRALEWEDAKAIDWGTVLLFGGGILLGDLAQKSGLATQWGESLVTMTGASSTIALCALCATAALVLSELASNTTAATLMVPLSVALATAANVPVEGPVLAATLGASFGFAMPISTPPNALAYGTGRVSMKQLACVGIVVDVLGLVAVIAVAALWSTWR